MRARQQFGHAERLHDIVVGTELQEPDFFRFVGANRKHDQGHARPGPQALQHVGAVHIRQAEVEDHEIGRFERCRAQGLGAGLGLLHREAVQFEAGAQEAPDLDFVVDNKHARRNFIHQ